MIRNTWHTKHTTIDDRRLQKEVRNLIIKYVLYQRNHKYSEYLAFECHSISMAIAQIIPELRCVHGLQVGIKSITEVGVVKAKLAPVYYYHSWLETPDESIIDAYPIGFMSLDPALIITKGPQRPAGGGMYIKDEQTIRDRIGAKMFRKSNFLVELMKECGYVYTEK